MIPSYAKSYFEIKDGDDAGTTLNKKYLLDRDRINKQLEVEQKLNEFNKKYADIKKMKSKTTLQQLQLQLAIEELHG
jgi:hypothetical protein